MSQASSSKIYNYDVFLSFRGVDTRRNIVSHLYNALQQRGIHTFKDDERLETGKPISDELLKAIKEARFAVVIFSKSYASSRWCLEELAHIIKCKNELEQIVIPFFYDVSPSDVRHQNGPFTDSFSQHEEKYKDDMEMVQRWRGAFLEAGKLSGYHLLNFKDGADCIKKIVDDIFPKSLQIISPLPENLVGMESQVGKVTSLLDMESNDVRSIGLWGMGGIGKTEIANVLHQRYRHRFEADCFLGNVGERHQKNGLTWLQEVVICKLTGERTTLTNIYEGKNILHGKKVLLTLDDVNHRKQLETLVGEPESFGKGSRIMLTARDKHLLISHVGENVYEVQPLSEDAALELFSRNAFKEKSPKEDFMELSTQVVKHAGGLPLALEVLGGTFYGRDEKYWRERIDRLKRIPEKDILEKLRLSFDGLDEDEKELFLDSVFLESIGGVSLNFYVKILYVKRLYRDASILLDSLIEKSLLSSCLCNGIKMHNMIKEMGENVIREEYANTRIWRPEEVRDLFEGKLKTEKVESLHIPRNCSFEDDLVNYNNIFKGMQSLRILIVRDYAKFDSNCTITDLPSSLRLIEWPQYPSTSLPESFEPSKLVVLTLHDSCLVELLPISKKLNNLKYLHLSHSRKLTQSPNFGDMPNLERLNLGWCKNLEEVHDSLGRCRMLTYLSLKYCVKLKKLPKFECMDSLETLNLDGCTSLQEFPEICGDMHRLSRLSVESPKIRSLPPSLSGLRDLRISRCNELATLPNSLFESQQLENLRIEFSGLEKLPISLGVQKKLDRLEIENCEKLEKLPSIIQMESLKILKISNCPKLDTFPEIKGDMHCLEFLTLNFTGIREVPSFIWQLRGLKSLSLEGFENLVSLPDSLCNLTNLYDLSLRKCKKLEKLPENIRNLRVLKFLNLEYCEDLVSLPDSLCKMNLHILSLKGCKKLEKLPENIGDLRGLESLNLEDCEDLVSLPDSLCKMNLQRLSLKGCKKLEKLPENIGDLRGLESLNLEGCEDLVSLPDSLYKMNLQRLSLKWCRKLEKLPLNIGSRIKNYIGPRVNYSSFFGHQKKRRKQ